MESRGELIWWKCENAILEKDLWTASSGGQVVNSNHRPQWEKTCQIHFDSAPFVHTPWRLTWNIPGKSSTWIICKVSLALLIYSIYCFNWKIKRISHINYKLYKIYNVYVWQILITDGLFCMQWLTYWMFRVLWRVWISLRINSSV